MVPKRRWSAVGCFRPKEIDTKAILLFGAALAVVTTPAFAAPCRDAKGKFIKCATAAPAKPKRCKDAKGKFAKCDAPGAHPA